VLVVHDVHAERRRLADSLVAEGITVIEAADGEQALAYARRLRPQVILSEIALPRLDAVGLLQALAAEQLTPRVLIHTRQTDAELHAWMLELGAEEVLASSVTGRALVGRLRGIAVA
jgi:DNA-binding response OmpR family regulator